MLLRVIAILAVVTFPSVALAQADEHDEHHIVYSLGWAGEASRSEGFHPAGVEGGFELTPIEGMLSIETTVGAHHSDEGTELPIEVAIRKPWQLSPTVEFMAGVAPALIHRFGAEAETFGAVSIGGHVMVWPRPNVGWYVESAFEVAFPKGSHPKSVEFSAGILIGR